MAIGNWFRKKFNMDNDGVVSEKELHQALKKAHDVFEQTLRFDIDRDPRFNTRHNVTSNGNYMTVELTYGEEGKRQGLVGRITIDKHSGDYRVESFFDRGSRQYQREGEEVAKTRDFGKDNTPKTRGGQFSDSKRLGRHEPTGEWELKKVVYERGAGITTSHGVRGKIEYGDIVMVDPKGREVFREAYVSGPYGSGSPPDKDRYRMAKDLCEFTPVGCKSNVKMSGHRILTDNGGRTKYLNHDDGGVPGSRGCNVFVREGAFNNYMAAWNSIPRNERPDFMEREWFRGGSNSRDMAAVREAVDARGMDFKNLPRMQDVDDRNRLVAHSSQNLAQFRGRDRS